MPVAPRFHCPLPLTAGAIVDLPPGAARHVQVLRLQPGATITVFGGVRQDGAGDADGARFEQAGGEFEASVLEIGRSAVRVRIGRHVAVEREPARRLHLATGMPANERMDWLIEKATELGAASVQGLMTERSVVRLDGERAHKRTVHWHSIAIAACEQCGRNQVPILHAAMPLRTWLAQLKAPGGPQEPRLLLSFRVGAQPLREAVQGGAIAAHAAVTVLSGPEGGLSVAEEDLALDLGFAPVTLGPRVLRAETAALVALTLLG